MNTVVDRSELRNAAYTGVTAGLILAGFEMVATALATGPAGAVAPLRMVSAIVLGPAALDSHYSVFAAIIIGLALELLLSMLCGVLFASGVSRIVIATEGELLTTSGSLAVAGTVFGIAVWIVGFYVVAPLGGWMWFRNDLHHIIAFVGYAFFFGCPLGWMHGMTASRRTLRS